MIEKSIPFLKAEEENRPDKLEEEFCVAYVACTRAKKILRMYMEFMSGMGEWSRRNKMSRFIREVYKSTREKYFNFRVLDVSDEKLHKEMIYNKILEKSS